MNSPSTTVLVLGATGMLGNAVFRFLSATPGYRVIGSARSSRGLQHFDGDLRANVLTDVDVEQPDQLLSAIERARPQVIINCVGLVKQLAQADDPLTALPINAMLPHRLARLAAIAGARLVHVSTDCVFAGTRGAYKEVETPDATDLYGRSKLLGEVDYPHAITLRTSIIGHELSTAHGLVGWFLSQRTGIRGYTRAIFSGLPTVELARVMRDHVLPQPGLHGVYHVSSKPISKHDLLRLVGQAYGHDIDIAPDTSVSIDRSLDSSRFTGVTGYIAPDWPELVQRMRAFG